MHMADQEKDNGQDSRKAGKALAISSRAERQLQQLRNQRYAHEVVDGQGNLVGEIVEWLIDTKEDRITYAVVLCLDQTMLHGKLIPLPWTQLTTQKKSEGQRQFSIAVSRDSLLAAAGYRPGDWQDPDCK